MMVENGQKLLKTELTYLKALIKKVIGYLTFRFTVKVCIINSTSKVPQSFLFPYNDLFAIQGTINSIH